ncbi:hypothetical protein E2542_SST18327 [Spatholobus suberectus]|nr:hypothetical protein E2542_SST18327 [Spatholobus suberectus]
MRKVFTPVALPRVNTTTRVQTGVCCESPSSISVRHRRASTTTPPRRYRDAAAAPVCSVVNIDALSPSSYKSATRTAPVMTRICACERAPLVHWSTATEVRCSDLAQGRRWRRKGSLGFFWGRLCTTTPP